MKVEISSPGSLEVKAFLAADDTIVSEPQFYGKGDNGVVAVARVFDKDNNLLKVHLIEIDGDTGALSVRDKSCPTQARMYAKKQTSSAEAKPETPKPK